MCDCYLDKHTDVARWKNADEREKAEREMRERGWKLISVYGGLGTFGGEEVGVFVRCYDLKA